MRSMETNKKIMVLRVNAKHIPEVREVTSQLAKQSEEQAAFREKSKAVQSAHAWQDSRYIKIGKDDGVRHVAPWSIPSGRISIPKSFEEVTRGKSCRRVSSYYFRLRGHSYFIVNI